LKLPLAKDLSVQKSRLRYDPLAVCAGRSQTKTWEQIKTAHASGIGLPELARNAGISGGNVLSRAKRESWTQQVQCAKTLAKREDVFAV